MKWGSGGRERREERESVSHKHSKGVVGHIKDFVAKGTPDQTGAWRKRKRGRKRIDNKCIFGQPYGGRKVGGEENRLVMTHGESKCIFGQPHSGGGPEIQMMGSELVG